MCGDVCVHIYTHTSIPSPQHTHTHTHTQSPTYVTARTVPILHLTIWQTFEPNGESRFLRSELESHCIQRNKHHELRYKPRQRTDQAEHMLKKTM